MAWIDHDPPEDSRNIEGNWYLIFLNYRYGAHVCQRFGNTSCSCWKGGSTKGWESFTIDSTSQSVAERFDVTPFSYFAAKIFNVSNTTLGLTMVIPTAITMTGSTPFPSVGPSKVVPVGSSDTLSLCTPNKAHSSSFRSTLQFSPKFMTTPLYSTCRCLA